jgi:hypothetical protein
VEAEARMTTLDLLFDELQKGKVIECPVRSAEAQHYGLIVDDTIYIDPRPAVFDTLVHELLHRRFPAMSEREVTRKARRLVRRMDEEAKRKWWRSYTAIKTKRSRPVDADA